MLRAIDMTLATLVGLAIVAVIVSNNAGVTQGIALGFTALTALVTAVVSGPTASSASNASNSTTGFSTGTANNYTPIPDITIHPSDSATPEMPANDSPLGPLTIVPTGHDDFSRVASAAIETGAQERLRVAAGGRGPQAHKRMSRFKTLSQARR